MTLQHRFIENIPEYIEDGILYISIKYKTAIHLCICGCKNEVVTPISPTDWQLTFDGLSISLSPSIGNWSFECRSHYWITKNKIIISSKLSSEEITEGREKNTKRKRLFFKLRKKKNGK